MAMVRTLCSWLRALFRQCSVRACNAHSWPLAPAHIATSLRTCLCTKHIREQQFDATISRPDQDTSLMKAKASAGNVLLI